MSLPKVSVCVVTYNQQKYIRQCLQSILNQVTNFDFEVIVADDFSTDDTRKIIREFVNEYPKIVKPIFHEINIGPHKNFLYVHQQATGEYIAHLDGDDYCLPGKLQAQVNVLDRYPDCNIVWHRMLIETVDGVIKEGAFQGVENLGELKFLRADIIQYISIGLNSSKMYRKTVRDFDLSDFEPVDYFTNVEKVGDGFACFAGNKNYGVYRAGIGIASNGARTRQVLAKCFMYFHAKYPEHRLQVNTAALLYLIADLKNGRKTWPMFFVVWVKTFHIGSMLSLLKSIGFIKKLKIYSD